MDQLNQLLNAEIDPQSIENKAESKQDKGFTPEGIKKVSYIGSSFLQIQDGAGGSDYLLDYLIFKDIIESLGFNAKSLEISNACLLTGNDIIYDFDRKKVFVWEPPISETRLGKEFQFIRDNYDSELGRIYGDSLEDEREWYSILLNKI